MINLIKYTIATFLLLAGSLVWMDNAAGAKPSKVMVERVVPGKVTQGETKYGVVISGSGFDQGSTVRFLVAGTTEEAQMEIIGTINLIDGDLVIPTLVISETATVDFYDVEVRTSSGRRGKGTDLFKVEQKEGGDVNPTFDVTFSDDMSGSSGTNWQSSSDGHGVDYWRSEPLGGTGEINLDYFRVPLADGGPFSGSRGEDCFGTDSSTPIEGVQLWEESRSGDPILNLTFFGTTEDGAITFKYHLQLKGMFDDPSNWLPLDWTTVTMSSWKLRIAAKNLRKKYSNISCVGEGEVNFQTVIRVERN
jgi:hypothetical protein